MRLLRRPVPWASGRMSTAIVYPPMYATLWPMSTAWADGATHGMAPVAVYIASASWLESWFGHHPALRQPFGWQARLLFSYRRRHSDSTALLDQQVWRGDLAERLGYSVDAGLTLSMLRQLYEADWGVEALKLDHKELHVLRDPELVGPLSSQQQQMVGDIFEHFSIRVGRTKLIQKPQAKAFVHHSLMCSAKQEIDPEQHIDGTKTMWQVFEIGDVSRLCCEDDWEQMFDTVWRLKLCEFVDSNATTNAGIKYNNLLTLYEMLSRSVLAEDYRGIRMVQSARAAGRGKTLCSACNLSVIIHNTSL